MATLQIQTMTTVTVVEWHITADYFFSKRSPFYPLYICSTETLQMFLSMKEELNHQLREKKNESQEQGQYQPALLAETAQDVFLSQCHFPSGYFALG